jgi:hypothetical protein
MSRVPTGILLSLEDPRSLSLPRSVSGPLPLLLTICRVIAASVKCFSNFFFGLAHREERTSTSPFASIQHTRRRS